MIKYEYKEVKGYKEKKFIENGHTMFESDVLRRLERLAYLEENIKKGNKKNMVWFPSTKEPQQAMSGFIEVLIAFKHNQHKKVKSGLFNPITRKFQNHDLSKVSENIDFWAYNLTYPSYS